MKLSMNERLQLLGLLYMKQTGNLSSCNARFVDLNVWIADTEKRIAEQGSSE